MAPEGLQTQLDRMLADPRAMWAQARFFEELLHFDMADHMVKDAELSLEASP